MMIPKPSHGLHYHTMVFRYSHALHRITREDLGSTCKDVCTVLLHYACYHTTQLKQRNKYYYVCEKYVGHNYAD